MIIRLHQDSNAEIINPYDLKGFHIEANGIAQDKDDIEKAIKEFAKFEAPDPAWVSYSALLNWAALVEDAKFQDSLKDLKAAAIKYGWYDDDTDAIKAHIEY